MGLFCRRVACRTTLGLFCRGPGARSRGSRWRAAALRKEGRRVVNIAGEGCRRRWPGHVRLLASVRFACLVLLDGGAGKRRSTTCCRSSRCGSAMATIRSHPADAWPAGPGRTIPSASTTSYTDSYVVMMILTGRLHPVAWPAQWICPRCGCACVLIRVRHADATRRGEQEGRCTSAGTPATCLPPPRGRRPGRRRRRRGAGAGRATIPRHLRPCRRAISIPSTPTDWSVG
jgi:hypothetical protein